MNWQKVHCGLAFSSVNLDVMSHKFVLWNIQILTKFSCSSERKACRITMCMLTTNSQGQLNRADEGKVGR